MKGLGVYWPFDTSSLADASTLIDSTGPIGRGAGDPGVIRHLVVAKGGILIPTALIVGRDPNAADREPKLALIGAGQRRRIARQALDRGAQRLDRRIVRARAGLNVTFAAPGSL